LQGFCFLVGGKSGVNYLIFPLNELSDRCIRMSFLFDSDILPDEVIVAGFPDIALFIF
jgi:hypothetical protein